MLETLMAMAQEKVPDYSEKVLWCALKYALCLDEGDAAEAVIFTLKPKIGEIGDQVLSDMLTAVESYLQAGLSGAEDKSFVPEWSDVRAWLLAERNRRIRKSREAYEG